MPKEYALHQEKTQWGYYVSLQEDADAKGEGRSRFYWLALWRAHKDLKKKQLEQRDY